VRTGRGFIQNERDDLAAQVAVGSWRAITEGNQNQLRPYFQAGVRWEIDRQSAAQKDLEERSHKVNGVVLVVEGSRTFGFDVWYGRNEEKPFGEIAGWQYPVVMALAERDQKVTIGTPNNSVAEKLFGPGGLKNVFAALEPPGWGGRESVGGSPRDATLSTEQVMQAARKVGEIARERSAGRLPEVEL